MVTSNNKEPKVSDFTAKDAISLNYDEKEKKFKTSKTITKYYELNQDIYINILETDYDIEDYDNQTKVVASGIKAEKNIAVPTDYRAFFATQVADNGDQIVTTFIHDESNHRKLQVKLGKITDMSILQKIKNNDTAGFRDLLEYSKKDNALVNETMEADKNSPFLQVDRDPKEGESVIDLSKFEKNAYYYLYVKSDDENGKYISNEAVTFGIDTISAFDDMVLLEFYGSEDFNWDGVTDTNVGDITVATKDIPQTGEKMWIFAMCGTALAALSVFAYVHYKKNNY